MVCDCQVDAFRCLDSVLDAMICAQYHTTLLPKQRFFHFSKIGWMGLKHTRPEIKHKSEGQVLCNKTLTTLIMSL